MSTISLKSLLDEVARTLCNISHKCEYFLCGMSGSAYWQCHVCWATNVPFQLISLVVLQFCHSLIIWSSCFWMRPILVVKSQSMIMMSRPLYDIVCLIMSQALFDCKYKLDCWLDCSQIVARLFCGAQPPMRDSVWQHIKSGWHLVVGMNVPITEGSRSLPQGHVHHHEQ
jgi:hypothetical protein